MAGKITSRLIDWFKHNYLDSNKKLKILDVGSLDVNGNCRKTFNENNWQYVGLDVESGKNVDIVVSSSAKDWEIHEEYDVILCLNTLEHVPDMTGLMKRMSTALKPDGLLFVIVPGVSKEGTCHSEHRYPVDCWRILPDGLDFLFCNAGLQTITTEVYHSSTAGVASRRAKRP
jgi:predicted SAM-dependent methyltransferase